MGKKIKLIVAMVVRLVAIFAPGVAFAWYAWQKVPALFAVASGMGLEAVWLFIFAFGVTAFRAAKDKGEKPEGGIE